jgi:anthranilate 1,2-dioxygenase small subunit
MSDLTRCAGLEVSPVTNARISRLMAHYCSSIDNDDLERWPTFFTEECLYRILTRTDFNAGRDFGVWFCNNRGMLEDRVSAIRSVNVFEPHVYRHLLGPTEIVGVDDEGIACETNYLVVRTSCDGDMQLFSTGRYIDRIVADDKQVLLHSRVVVTDSQRYDTLVALPI